MVPPRPKEEVLFNVFEPKLVDSLLYAMIEFFNHGTQWGTSCPLSPTLLLDLHLEAGYTFAPFGGQDEGRLPLPRSSRSTLLHRPPSRTNVYLSVYVQFGQPFCTLTTHSWLNWVNEHLMRTRLVRKKSQIFKFGPQEGVFKLFEPKLVASATMINFLTRRLLRSCEHKAISTLLRITHLAHRKSYLVIICPNSHEKSTKSEIMKHSSRFEHCSESLI